MKKLFFVVGLFFIVITIVIIGIVVLFQKSAALNAESKAFVGDAIQAISASLDDRQLLDRATPELRKAAKPEDIGTLMATLSRLGPLVKYEGATGEASVSFIAGVGSTTVANYVAKARFRNGNAIFRIGLAKRDGQWMINDFHVDSDLTGEPARGA